MNLNLKTRRSAAFTMVEMVGVLAVIAILASLLTPKIFASINEARLNAAVGSLDAVKAATVSYYSKNGYLPTNNAVDMVLVTAEFLERPFQCKVGNGSCVRGVEGKGGNGSTASGYKMDGTNVVTTSAAVTVECVLSNVNIADAWELSKQIDGDILSAANAASADANGRVIYAHTTGVGNVYVYIGHR